MTGLVTEHLPFIAEASDGISALRDLILELAVQGRLFQRDLTAPGWQRLKLPEIAVYRIGKTPPSKEARHWDDAGIPWVSISDMEHFTVLSETSRSVSKEMAPETFRYPPVPAGSLLMSFKLTVGKICVLGVDAYHNEAIISLQPKQGVLREYLMRVLPSIARAGRTKDALMGATLNSSSLAELIVPLPSLTEQHRIVAKVDELMALCDRLEADQADAEAAHAQLVQALLASLTQATDAADFRAHWQRLSEHFHTLFTTEASIDALRRAFLHLAADGRLLESDGHFVVIAVGDVLEGNTLNGCSHKPTDEARGIPILRISAGTGSDDFYVDESDHRWVEMTAAEQTKFSLAPDDLLACRFNGNLHYVGSFALYRGLLKVAQTFPDKLIRFKVNRELVLPMYLRLVMNAKPARDQIESFCATTVGNIGISASNLKTVKIRVPSVSEQHRIVGKVDELMALCDQLKAQLAEARQQHAQLATALIEQAVA